MTNTSAHFDTGKILNWNKGHVVLLFFTSVILLIFNKLSVLTSSAILSFSVYFFLFRKPLNQYSPFSGYANLITVARILTLGLMAPIWAQINHYLLASVFSFIILLDWLDGYLARKLHLNSDFGAYLDMETDALVVAVLSYIVWIDYDLHWIVLVAAFLRYPYAILLFFIVRSNKKEPRRTYAAYITAIYYSSLIYILFINNSISQSLLYLSSILIILSFSRSFYFHISG